jgi:hypothetical protein
VINAFNLGPGGLLLFELRVIIAKKAAEEATVIFDGWVCRTRKTLRIQAVAVWFIVLFISRVVHKESILCWGMTNNDAIHCVGLMLGALEITIVLVMKKAPQGEQWNPSALVVTNTMDEYIR